MTVRPAIWAEKKAIHAIAKLSPYTKKWADVYYLQQYFEREAIGVCYIGFDMAGFIMLHHCVKRPYSSVYYAGVKVPRCGIGTALMEWAWQRSPHTEYRLTVDADNTVAQQFWARCGFVQYGTKPVKDGHLVVQMYAGR